LILSRFYRESVSTAEKRFRQHGTHSVGTIMGPAQSLPTAERSILQRE